MEDILRDMSESALIPAIEANLREEMACFGRYLPGGELHEDAEMQWIITELFNSVLRTSIVAGDINAKIDATLGYFSARCTSMGWEVSPSARPADLATYLQARGFTLMHDQAAMAANLHALHEDIVMPDNFRVQVVEDREMLKTYCDVSRRGFDSSEHSIKAYYKTYLNMGFAQDVPWRHYIGWLNEKPVTVSSLLLHAGVAGVYGVATVPEARRQGFGASMTLTPLQEARRRGYRIGILTPSEMGLGVYQRLGFSKYYTTSIYHKSFQEHNT